VTVQGDAVVKTQLMAGAPTVTTFNGTARTATGPKQTTKASESFFMMDTSKSDRVVLNSKGEGNFSGVFEVRLIVIFFEHGPNSAANDFLTTD